MQKIIIWKILGCFKKSNIYLNNVFFKAMKIKHKGRTWKFDDSEISYWDNLGNVKYRNVPFERMIMLPKRGTNFIPDNRDNFQKVIRRNGGWRYCNVNDLQKTKRIETDNRVPEKEKRRLRRKGVQPIEFISKDVEKDSEFKSYLTGKRVAFVGPADSISGKGLGELIESYDVVVRTNASFNINPGDEVDYGRRTDVLYINGLFRKRGNIENETTRNFQYICSQRNVKGIEDKIRLYKFKQETSKRYFNGTYAIADLLNQNPKELFITGIDFFTGENSHKESFQYLQNNQSTVNSYLKKYHNSEKDFKYFKEVIIKNNIVKLDDKLTSIFNYKTLSDYNENGKLEDYFRILIEGKSVIYVGPSPILEGKGMGEFIDSFDVVVRSNNSYPVPEHLHKDYGSKCDILYTNVYFSKEINKLNDKRLYNKLKLICSKKQRVNVNKNRIFKLKRTEFLSKNKVHLTGNHTYLDILEQNPERFHITGITFYLDDKFHKEEFSYNNKHSNRKGFNKYHSERSEINLFLCEVYPKVTVDDFLLDLFKENNYLK